MSEDRKKKFLLRGAREICEAVGENPRNIKDLVEKEGLPAWKRSDNDKEPWRAHPERLAKWAKEQDEKYRSKNAVNM